MAPARRDWADKRARPKEDHPVQRLDQPGEIPSGIKSDVAVVKWVLIANGDIAMVQSQRGASDSTLIQGEQRLGDCPLNKVGGAHEHAFRSDAIEI